MAIGHIKDIMEASVAWDSAAHKLTALVMAYSADRKGVIRLTQQEIAEEVMLSRRRVADLIDDLCEKGVLARLGHGRYGIRFGLPKTDAWESAPQPKGAEEEYKRLQSIRKPGEEAIYWQADGWPILGPNVPYPGED
ncbi:MAG: hypothetical protein O2854_09370 [Chloroflexi bacterium]|nr:hypothetical protein [Chloroflexota bacterium]